MARTSRRRPYSEQSPAELGGGVWSVPVPIPGNPLGYTLVYALDSPAGPVLVDAGWNHPDAWAALSGGLAEVGVDVRGVRGVVVTHFHPDHAGLAGRVREESGAWIAMHEADAALVRMIRGTADAERRAFQADMLRRAGAAEAEVAPATGHRPTRWARSPPSPPMNGFFRTRRRERRRSANTTRTNWHDLPPILRGMAAGEAAAHLRTLEVRGLVRRLPNGDQVLFEALDS